MTTAKKTTTKKPVAKKPTKEEVVNPNADIDAVLEDVIRNGKFNAYKGKALVIGCIGTTAILGILATAALFNSFKAPDTIIKISYVTYSLPTEDRDMIAAFISSKKPTAKDSHHVNQRFTVFNTVLYKNYEIITGWNFEKATSKLPADQYCYAARPATLNSTTSDFIIARKVKGEGTSFKSVQDAKTEGYNKVDYAMLKILCRWFTEEKSAKDKG